MIGWGDIDPRLAEAALRAACEFGALLFFHGQKVTEATIRRVWGTGDGVPARWVARVSLYAGRQLVTFEVHGPTAHEAIAAAVGDANAAIQRAEQAAKAEASKAREVINGGW